MAPQRNLDRLDKLSIIGFGILFAIVLLTTTFKTYNILGADYQSIAPTYQIWLTIAAFSMVISTALFVNGGQFEKRSSLRKQFYKDSYSFFNFGVIFFFWMGLMQIIPLIDKLLNYPTNQPLSIITPFIVIIIILPPSYFFVRKLYEVMHRLGNFLHETN